MGIPMNTDKLTSLIGVLMGALHQVGLVGTIPQTKTDWYNTLVSAGMVALGYFVNKK